MTNMWETVIGLEIHVQLATNSKLFSSSSTNFGAEQNTQASVIDLAMPGVLPVLNKKAVEMAIMFGLSVDAKIAEKSIFARKNYFYPDLPKGYQISQYELPVVYDGKLSINVDGNEKVIGITRAHLEEDAGKSIHDLYDGQSAIDLNRAGTGGSDLPNLKAEFNDIPHLKGVLSMARSSDPNSANSQFFICFEDAPHLDRQYTVFGRVVEGMEFVDKIKRGDGPNGSVSNPDKIISFRSL